MIFVSGASGQLGCELKKKLGDKAVFLQREQLDLSNSLKLDKFFQENHVELFINAGAYTLVDKAETEKELAININSIAPKIISHYSRVKKFKLIHFSTDYVFNGKSVTPYTENDPVEPVNFYGQTKLDGERGVMEENPDNLIIRTSWVYSSFGKNFIKTILKFGQERENLNVVYDQVGSLTFAEDLAEVALKARDLSGIYHFSGEGVSSWYDVAHELKRLKNFKAMINPILSHEYPTPAKRPSYSVLNKDKIKKSLGIKIPHWTESLELCLKNQF